MLTLIINVLRNRLIEYRHRAALRALLEKDDRLLRDAGLTRPDIESALSKPYRISAWERAHCLSAHSLYLDRA